MIQFDAVDKYANPNVVIKRAAISCASADAAGNTLVAAVTGKKIGVVSMLLMAAGDVTATFYTGAADTGTALSGAVSLGTSGGCALPGTGLLWLESAAGEALTLLLGGAVQVSGFLNYVEV